MALTWDITKLDISDVTEFWESTEFDDKGIYTNWNYFQTFVFRLMVLRPSDSGDITIENVKETIIRNRMYESACDPGMVIPIAFIRRMIGLRTNVAPRHNRKEFGESLERIIRDSVVRYLPDGWDNF